MENTLTADRWRTRILALMFERHADPNPDVWHIGHAEASEALFAQCAANLLAFHNRADELYARRASLGESAGATFDQRIVSWLLGSPHVASPFHQPRP